MRFALRRIAPVLPLALVLAVPFLLRPKHRAHADDGAALIVLTAHNEAIRSEFGARFRAHMQSVHGTTASIDWRSPGGASEISRYLTGQFVAAFRRQWTGPLGRPWTARVAGAFANPAVFVPPSAAGAGTSPAADSEEQAARRAFLNSNVSAGADVLFGGGSSDFIAHAAAGRLVDAGIVRAHPDVFNADVVPSSVGGEPYWDEDGRWVGACLASYGICYNRDSVARLGQPPPAAWSDLGAPQYAGQIALAEPSKSGSALKAFEMVIQQQMQLHAPATIERGAEGGVEAERRVAPSAPDHADARRQGWAAAMRLIRRIAANARYFTDAASKVPVDVAAGDAAAGMCIDFYGRVQAETISVGTASRLAFVTPRGGSSIGADSIAVLRGAPHPDLAKRFVEFVLSEEGQKLWNYRVGTPGGPERYALRRLPILPALYQERHLPYRSDPEARPYDDARSFHYEPSWTAHLLRSIAFIIRVMCVEPHDELARAYRAIAMHPTAVRAAALFDDVTSVDYAQVNGSIRPILASANPAGEIALANDMIRAFRRQYEAVVALAEAER